MARPAPAHAARVHADISPSGADRWWNCPGSVRLIAELQAAGTIPMESASSHAADAGTAAHELLEMSLKAGRAPVSFLGAKVNKKFEVDHAMATCVEEAIDYIGTFRTPGDLLYTEEELDIPCTGQKGHVDVARVCKDYLDVFDYKNGTNPVHAKQNKQGLLYACGVWAKLTVMKHKFLATIKLVRIHIIQPNTRDTSCGPTSVYKLKPAALQEFATEAANRVRAIRSGVQPCIPGELQCYYCPAKAHCRTLKAVSLKATRLDWDTAKKGKLPMPSAEPLTMAELAESLDAMPVVQLWAEAVAAQARDALLRGKKIPRYKLVEGRSQRRWADEAKVMAALAKMKIPTDNYAPRKLVGLGACEALLKKELREKFFATHTIKPRGNPALAPESDPRPLFDKVAGAKADFEEDIL